MEPAENPPAPDILAPTGPPGGDEPGIPEPDDKDWTWTLTRRCDECGLSVGEIPSDELGDRLFMAAEEWVAILRSSPAVEVRPEPTVWSPLEYGVHIRDVLRIFDARLVLILTQDDARFANWDQNRAALEGRYWEQDPDEVADAIEADGAVLVRRIAGLDPEAWHRTGIRSNGSEFAVTTLLQYLLHDVVHHLYDVTGQQDGAASLALE